MYRLVSLWLIVICFWAVEATPGKPVIDSLSIDLNSNVYCRSHANGTKKVNIVLSLPDTESQRNLTFSEDISGKNPKTWLMSCRLHDQTYRCDLGAYTYLELDLYHIWKSPDKNSKAYVAGRWLKNTGSNVEKVFCQFD